ncbi:hemagglutinin domain-containing protein [Campylobacter pinnipediorum subsp. caledonicus]|uniref:two-partner secretion domain-containing protein n=2 Tax=Campylobacter pinnipediorum TaxID=1965231 RepID=UPI0009C1B8B0|nr:hemagglutinin repeat-containing protein [Campylobacter pinnipediorum]AQW86717.1 hemagglutinin domain-containing protein [Campylobacter pinnipediorum subsp. caledonicus]
MKQVFKKIVSVIISSMLIVQQGLLASSIDIDTNAPIKNRASLDKARNGVPIVNIVKPNNEGLSHNKFSNYNVEKKGAILNNSNKRDVNTKLSGYIYGNKNLANSKTAKIILNEVTSKRKTRLEGFTEVAGDRASVVISNPNGIYINGAGFINTKKATITTANPSIKNEKIDSYEIDKGLIQIEKDGLNTKNVDKAELYANTIELNAKIHANDLEIITGKNKILNNETIISKNDTESNKVSLDSSSLGGIYANRIKLIGTSRGVGVNLKGEISAQNNLEINSRGKIVLNKALSGSKVEIKTDDNLESNTIYGSNIDIEAKNNIHNKDIIASKTDIKIKSKSLINDNVIASGIEADLKVAKRGSLNIQSDKVVNKNTFYAKDDVYLSSKFIKNTKNSQINSGKNIAIKTKTIDNEESVKIIAEDKIDIINTNDIKSNRANIEAKDIFIDSNVFNSENSNIVATKGNLNINSNIINLDNSRQIAALNDISLTSDNISLNGANLLSQNSNINIDSSNLNAIKANIGANLLTTIKSKNYIKANGISLESGKIDIFTKNLILSDVNMDSKNYSSKLLSKSLLDIKASDILNTNGYIGALKDISITSSSLDNTKGTISSNENINIIVNSLKNTSGLISSKNHLTLKLDDYKDVGSILQSGDLRLNGQSLNLHNSKIISTNKDINLNIYGNSSFNDVILYSNKDINLDSKNINGVKLKSQAKENIKFNASNLEFENSTIYNIADIDKKYKNGYRQGDISFISNSISLKNSNLASKNLTIESKDKLNILSLNNSLLEANNNINILTKKFSTISSTLSTLNDLNLKINSIENGVQNSNFNGKNVDIKIDGDLLLQKDNSIKATNSIKLQSNSIINKANIISDNDIFIEAKDYITNNNQISSKTLKLKAKNHINNERLNDDIVSIKGAFLDINTDKLTNKALLYSIYDMNINTKNLDNYGAIASSNNNNYSSNLNIISNNLKNYNTIYSSNNLNLYIKDSLINQTDKIKVDLGDEKAIIFAKNDINIKRDKDKSLRTESILNDKATIQTQNKDINIFAKSLKNISDKPDLIGKYDKAKEIVSDGKRTYLEKKERVSTGGPHYNLVTRYIDEMYVVPKKSPNAEIISGMDIKFDVDYINNEFSKIISGNNIYFNSKNILNQEHELVKLTTTEKEVYRNERYCKHRILGHCVDHGDKMFYKGTQTSKEKETFKIGSLIFAKNNLIGKTDGLVNGNIDSVVQNSVYNPNLDIKLTKTNLSSNKINIKDSLINQADINLDTIDKTNFNRVVNTIKDDFNLPKNRYSFFIHNPNNPNYLIESNPLYTELSNYLGSSYFLQKINYRGDRKIKSIGDAAYETKLVSDALRRHLGRAYINDNYFTNPNAQYIKFMDNAVNQSSILGLTLGKELTQEQLANLKEDIVWYVSKVINNEEVLVPVVYLAKDYKKIDGATITAKNVKLDVKDKLVNSGSIISKEYLNLQANTIVNNTGLLLSHKKLNLIANKDIANKNGATIKAGDINIVSKDGSVINETFVKQVRSGDNYNNTTYTQISKPSSIIATNNNLIINAKKDIKDIAGNLEAKNTIRLSTITGNIDINSKELKDEFNSEGGSNFYKTKNTDYLSSNLNANNIIISSNKDVNIEASNLKADNIIGINADKNLNITALNSIRYKDIQTHSKGFFSSKTTRDMSYKESVNSSLLKAKNILLNSNNDINLEATSIKAKDNIVANAKNDINLLAKDYAIKELHYTNKKGFGGFSRSVSLNSNDNLNLHSTKLQTEAKNIVLNSKKDINILASEVLSAGDIELKALNDVLISSRQELEKNVNYSKKTKFNPLGALNLVGIDITPLYSQKLHEDELVKSKSKESLLVSKGNTIIDSGSTALVGSNLNSDKNIYIKADTGKIDILPSVDNSNKQTLDKKAEVKVSNLVNQIKNDIKELKKFDTKVKAQIAEASYDKEAKILKDTLNLSSNLIAKENIIANSLDDLNIKGSNLKAGGNVVLNSKIGDVNILNSTDTKDKSIKEEHLKASLSLTAQNEYVEIATAVMQAQEAAKQLKQTKSNYTKYKKEVKKLENKLGELKNDYKNKKIGVDYSDIEDLVDIIDNLKSQEKYYLANIGAATINLATKTTAIASQAAAAAASSATYGFSLGISADVNGEKSNTKSTTNISTPSNVKASNILINTNKKLNTNTIIKGSNLIAKDELNINTHNLDISASNDFGSTNKNTKSTNGSVNFTMYGGGGGSALLSYGQSRYDSSSSTFNNSNLKSNNINIDVVNDALFKGATLRANNTLNLNVGNNLDVISLQDEYTYSNKGFNVSAGVGFKGDNAKANRVPSIEVSEASSANAGFNINNSIGLNKQSVLTSLTGTNLNIDVKNNTHLKGSLIASGKFDDKANFIDNKKLNFKTNTLTFENLSNTNYNSSKSIGINLNLSSKDKDDNKDNKNLALSDSDSKDSLNNKVNGVSNTISSLGYNQSNSLNMNNSKTLATLGKGSITILDKANSDDLQRLNTDTSKLSNELYSSQTNSKVDASLDTRLLGKEGREQIKHDYENMNKNMNIVASTLPDEYSDNKVEAAFGKALNVLATATLGVLPNNGRGGLLANLPVLTGTADSEHRVLQIVNGKSPKHENNKEGYIEIEKSKFYKRLDEKGREKLKGLGLYISKKPVTISKVTVTSQNSVNGILNPEINAIINGLEQTGQSKATTDKPVELNVAYNPTYGFMPDLLESLVDKAGLWSTGIAKQTGRFVKDTIEGRGGEEVNFAFHSQANLLGKSGIKYINKYEGGFMKIENTDPDKKPSFSSFGSPVNAKDMSDLIANKPSEGGLGYKYNSVVKDGDFVGEGLGGNKGVNKQADILDRLNLINIFKLFTSDSPHSSYICEDYENIGVVCGYRE